MTSLRWAAVVAALPLASALAGPVQAVETGGIGELYKCPSLPTHFCRTYHHIRLPERIALGDVVPVVFGSNRKEFRFPVAEIVLGDGRCTLYASPDPEPDSDRIEIAVCRAAVP